MNFMTKLIYLEDLKDDMKIHRAFAIGFSILSKASFSRWLDIRVKGNLLFFIMCLVISLIFNINYLLKKREYKKVQKEY